MRLKTLEPSESAIEQAILTWLRYNNIFAWKNVTGGYFDPKLKRFKRQKSSFAINGVSDIIGIYLGRPLFIEVKSKTGRLTPEQESFLEKARGAGAIAFVARSIEDVEREIKMPNHLAIHK